MRKQFGWLSLVWARGIWGLKGLNFRRKLITLSLCVNILWKIPEKCQQVFRALRSIQLKICGERESAVESSPTRTRIDVPDANSCVHFEPSHHATVKHSKQNVSKDCLFIHEMAQHMRHQLYASSQPFQFLASSLSYLCSTLNAKRRYKISI